MIIPSTTITVLRTDELDPPLDEFGDPTDSDTVMAVGLPATITAQQERTRDPGSGQVTVIDWFLIELRPRVFVFTERDRVKDERTGIVYQVENVRTSSAMLMQEAIQLRCTAVS